MKTNSASKPPASIDAYVEGRPAEVQTVLREIFATIRRAAPGASERLSYNMPTFFLGRVLVHIGAFQSHIGLFPPVHDAALQEKVAPYRGEKGNLRFPLDQPIPYDLIEEIVRGRAEAIAAKAPAKAGRG